MIADAEIQLRRRSAFMTLPASKCNVQTFRLFDPKPQAMAFAAKKHRRLRLRVKRIGGPAWIRPPETSISPCHFPAANC
jgi:hypothetical protein